MCETVEWCNRVDRFYSHGLPRPQCSIHIQYKDWVSNATTRPWLMYKLERILDDKLYCEMCGFDPFKAYPDRDKRQLVSLLDVDHIDPSIKYSHKGEQPSNYQLVCKHCHVLKSHDNDDYNPNKKK